MGFDIKRMDIYRKVPKDLTQPTTTGAIVSICCCIFIASMLFVELLWFISPDIKSELIVENNDPTERIPVRINVSIPNMRCEFLGIDIQDDQGRHEVGFIENTVKTPLGDTGCLFEAKFQVNKVPGNFHLSTHSVDVQPDQYDFAHEIHEISFGSKIRKISAKNIRSSFNPLGGRSRLDGNSLESHEYIMRIVPTTYEDLNGFKLTAFQYTYAYRSHISFGHGGRVIPALWFRYDLNPITVRYHEDRPPLYHFLTTICAIVGGTFTVAGIIDSCIFSATEILKKFELGKLS
ncbi:endoplasmic reticulum-Golgi intermediate compartment protein 1 [Eurytemora carolleeae]|uniref:endoplasmic reticulum-Golgi intermediate compartment protein 1 n=1 Tax=Eurytemora carolleeae TaxID=1294199 RepID=UPI000C7885A3|nr:endoplasmic reticulum-Golgi intermediate compartment protein 1 [Eurytemora carolleeae]|eukprot:XP_023326552.1 endoplasmic reticulum-Golgi intermediate compartment protein 1-like [Eurytemora affinis]